MVDKVETISDGQGKTLTCHQQNDLESSYETIQTASSLPIRSNETNQHDEGGSEKHVFSIFEYIEDELLSIFKVFNGLSDQGPFHSARSNFHLLIDKCSDEAKTLMFDNAKGSKIQVDIDDEDSRKVHTWIGKSLTECEGVLDRGNKVMDIGKKWLKHLFEEEMGGCLWSPGPCGEKLIHSAFIWNLGDVALENIKGISTEYGIARIIGAKFENDLHHWKPFPLQSDHGLYTGETVLHMAIVNKAHDLVQKLLRMGADLDSQATGLFFMPKYFGAKKKNIYDGQQPHDAKQLQTQTQRLSCYITKIGTKLRNLNRLGKNSVRENKYSGCYYGEFPLSFAASVGNVSICRLIIKAFLIRLKLKKQQFSESEEDYDMKKLAGEKVEELREFINRPDSFGNTALHMAVFHDRADVLVWMMSELELATNTPNRESSLEVCNVDGFTPFTLAVKLGNIKLFDLMVQKHMSKIIWSYGTVCKKFRLLQHSKCCFRTSKPTSEALF